jgi:PiT family inorganic phosphate transporter
MRSEESMGYSVIVIAVIVTALAFDFTNGFHDTANAMATAIATGALKPRVAVLVAGAFNLIGAFLSVEVAKTISSGLVQESKVTPTVIFGGLIGAILWNLGTWLVGLPSSSSHALFGGLIGATWVAAGAGAINFGTVISKILLPAVLSPIIAGVVGLTATFLAYRITSHSPAAEVRQDFRWAQVASASTVALAHGSNDGQKTMGIITLTMITAGILPTGSNPPLWVIAACGLGIALGTCLGGWKIIQTMGKKISDIESPQGFAAETSSAVAILTSAHLGFALSTTHVCTGAIFGAGAGRRLASVNWGVARRMVTAWALTLPAAACVGAIAGGVAERGQVGTIVVGMAGAGIAAAIYLASRRNPVGAHNVNDASAKAPEPAPELALSAV